MQLQCRCLPPQSIATWPSPLGQVPPSPPLRPTQARLQAPQRAVNGEVVAETIEVSASQGVAYALTVRNLLVTHVFHLALAAQSFAGELRAGSLREDILRPVPRWTVIFAKWVALCVWSNLALVATGLTATLLGAALFQVLVWQTETFNQMLVAYGLMSMFFYGSAAVKFAYLAEVFPTRLRATALSSCGSLAVTLGSAAGPLMVARAVETLGWDMGYSVLVGVPLVMAGLLYLLLTPVPSGLEVEEVESLLRDTAAARKEN